MAKIPKRRLKKRDAKAPLSKVTVQALSEAVEEYLAKTGRDNRGVDSRALARIINR